ncbi:hypothetical protein [Kordia zhangzhouensis]|uniref:hypothetical protein n=1 Tax=Kordia zhangzhouensis TaxID=1620405 RepID=UPI000629C497|nr:hypothetical protein [Kordia zhangzhouensis]
MSDIQHIYHNTIGISFQWEKDLANNRNDFFQVIFRDTGFYLSFQQLESFAQLIQEAKIRGCCKNCEKNAHCRLILLKTPASQVDLAVSIEELETITDLVEGTLFQIKLKKYLNDVCRN